MPDSTIQPVRCKTCGRTRQETARWVLENATLSPHDRRSRDYHPFEEASTIQPDCPWGYSRSLLERSLSPEEMVEFDRFMDGQTQMICSGRSYDHETREYRPSACAGTPHGCVSYHIDVERFLGRRKR